ncbi:MAG: hypothetical protein JNK59_04700, partial [Sterolibacteriaceae bacterium]|nr:hypothetical protein [Sterolibacteriaceae bacterium]
MYLNHSSADQTATELAAASGAERRWLLCVADRHGEDLPALLAACDRHGLDVCGGIFPGLIQAGAGRDRGIVALPLPVGSQVALAHLGTDSLEWESAPPESNGNGLASSILLVDCLAPNIEGLMDQVYDLYGSRMNHIGAGTGYHDLRATPTIFTRAGLHCHAALMVSM